MLWGVTDPQSRMGRQAVGSYRSKERGGTSGYGGYGGTSGCGSSQCKICRQTDPPYCAVLSLPSDCWKRRVGTTVVTQGCPPELMPRCRLRAELGRWRRDGCSGGRGLSRWRRDGCSGNRGLSRWRRDGCSGDRGLSRWRRDGCSRDRGQWSSLAVSPGLAVAAPQADPVRFYRRWPAASVGRPPGP